MDKTKRFVDESGKLLGHVMRFLLIAWRHGVVVESDTVDDADEEK